MILILIIILFFLFIRKSNCQNMEKENFNNLNRHTDLINNIYFSNLKNDVLKKQSVRNLLF